MCKNFELRAEFFPLFKVFMPLNMFFSFFPKVLVLKSGQWQLFHSLLHLLFAGPIGVFWLRMLEKQPLLFIARGGGGVVVFVHKHSRLWFRHEF